MSFKNTGIGEPCDYCGKVIQPGEKTFRDKKTGRWAHMVYHSECAMKIDKKRKRGM